MNIKIISVLTALLLGVFISVSAQNIPLSTNDNIVELTSNNENGFSFELQLQNLSFETKLIQGKEYHQLSSNGLGENVQVGAPNLPVYRHLIEIPTGSNYEINFEVLEEELLSLSEYQINGLLMPKQPSLEKRKGVKPQFTKDDAIYKQNGFYALKPVAVENLGTMREQSFGRIELAPIAYNPIENTLRVYTKVRVEVTYVGGNKTAYKEKKQTYYSPAFAGADDHLLNAGAYPVVPPVGVQFPLSYVIVADSNYRSTLKPFIDWKTKQGYKVIEAYLQDPSVGSTVAGIKSYLQGLYNAATLTNPAPSYVLFVGDVVDVPSNNGTASPNNHITDLHYCEYTSDYMPEVFHGRFSVSNGNELTNIINKTLNYEKYLMTDPSFLGKSVLIAGQDNNFGPTHGDGQINYATSVYFNSTNNQTPYVYLHSVSATAESQIIGNINEGVGIVNYTAHGSWQGWVDPAFNITDANNLSNSDKYPVMIGNACETNRFEKGVCIGEALTRAQDKGAVAYIGASNNTLWDEDFYWAVGTTNNITASPTYAGTGLGTYDRLFHTHNEPTAKWGRTVTDFMANGNFSVALSGSNSSDYYWEIYHVMGDPSLMPYLYVPGTLTVTHVPLIPLGASSYNVTTEPFALVALSLNGQLIASDVADSLGSASLSFPTLVTAGAYDLVVTAQNMQPWMGQVTVTNPNGPYVVYKSFDIDDANGNNNQEADYGETFDLDVEIQNITSFTANSLQLTLQCSDPMITLIDSVFTLNTMQGASDSLLTQAFTVKTDSMINDQHLVSFTLKVEDASSNVWLSYFQTTVNAPKITMAQYKIVDAAQGNDNGKLDAGEQAELWIALKNEGHADIGSSVAHLTTTYTGLSIANSHSFNGITKNGMEWAKFDVTVSSSAVVGNVVNSTCQFVHGSMQIDKPIVMVIGSVDEDFETGDFSKFPWQTNGTGAWDLSTSNVFEGSYATVVSGVDHDDSGSLEVSMKVLQADSISFFKKVSSELNYDFLSFYIDNQLMATWSGTVAWSRESFAVDAGQHTFKWEYSKDFGMSAGQDKAWVDFIEFPVTDVWSGIKDPNAEVSLNVYPNPAVSTLNLDIDLIQEETFNIELYNAIGQLERSFIHHGQVGLNRVEMDLDKLQNGIYFVVLKGERNTLSRKLYILK